MKNPLNIRQNFYQGQSVSASNLTQLQDYSDNARNLIVSDILGYGIVSGFDVIKANKDNFTLSISSGLAYTQNGVRLETDKPKELFIKDFVKSADLPSGEAIITRYLAMSLDYDKTKPVTDSFNNSVLTEWAPTATPVLYAQAELITMNDILLAEIQINEYGTTEIIDRRKDFLDFNALSQKTSSFTTTKEEANTIASITADIFKINDKTLLEFIYPINTTYTQHPDKATGLFREEDSPLALLGGDWELVNTVLKNNVPETGTDENGTFWKYPDRTLKIFGIGGLLLGTGTVTLKCVYPHPFITKPTITNLYYSEGGEVSFNYSSTSYSDMRADTITNTEFRFILNSVIGIYANSYPKYTATGYWKNPTDPISADEEKNYVKIWKRIAPPIA